jgi:hypothetical protein
MLLLAACAGAPGCASEEIPKYGAPAQVEGTGGGGTGGNTGGGPVCDEDPACAVGFAADVLPTLDVTAKCSEGALCHGTDGSSPGGLTLETGNAASYYDALIDFVLEDGGNYIVPCDPAASKILCNLQVSDGPNPHGECGKAAMPVSSADAPSLAQLNDIEAWIECGAPNN